MAKNRHIGSSLDDLLEETCEQVEVKLKISHSALDRLLDPKNTSITLNSLDHAVRTIGKKIKIELVET